MRVLDLFSGIGGFSLGLERTGGFETIAFCEYEAFPRAVLRKHWPDVSCFPDVRTLKGSDIEGPVDVICGGYPCQPFSTAGQRRGKEDHRHLWPEFSRLVAELRPTWVIGENVAGHISMGLDDVLSDLEGQGYAARTFVIPACAVDAKHRRDRTWTVANRGGGRQFTEITGQVQQSWRTQAQRSSEDVANTEGQRFGEARQHSKQSSKRAASCGASLAHAHKPRPQGHGRLCQCSDQWSFGTQRWSEPGKWLPEPDVGRVAHGVSGRVDRLKALGNAVVPQVVQMIGHAILEAEAMR